MTSLYFYKRRTDKKIKFKNCDGILRRWTDIEDKGMRGFTNCIDLLGHAIRPGRLEAQVGIVYAKNRLEHTGTAKELRCFLSLCTVFHCWSAPDLWPINQWRNNWLGDYENRSIETPFIGSSALAGGLYHTSGSMWKADWMCPFGKGAWWNSPSDRIFVFFWMKLSAPPTPLIANAS